LTLLAPRLVDDSPDLPQPISRKGGNADGEKNRLCTTSEVSFRPDRAFVGGKGSPLRLYRLDRPGAPVGGLSRPCLGQCPFGGRCLYETASWGHQRLLTWAAPRLGRTPGRTARPGLGYATLLSVSSGHDAMPSLLRRRVRAYASRLLQFINDALAEVSAGGIPPQEVLARRLARTRQNDTGNVAPWVRASPSANPTAASHRSRAAWRHIVHGVPRPLALEGDIQIRLDFFPPAMVAELVADIHRANQRKREFDLCCSAVPTCVLDATRFASDTLRLHFNQAILKRYTHAEPSGAYEMHQDPVSLHTIPLVLATLSGSADLSVESIANSVVTIQCVPNMVVLLRPDLWHRISPPHGTERLFLFLGFEDAHHNNATRAPQQDDTARV
jgi:hypothetical protein